MSHPSRPSTRTSGFAAALLIVAVAAPAALQAQTHDRWQSTADIYDQAFVESHVQALRRQYHERHGPLAQAMWDMREELAMTPHELDTRPAAPHVAPLRFRVEAAHLVHYQAGRDGSLGILHGSVHHPIGLAWFPHSMFAQGGRLYGVWGYARLLVAVEAHAARHGE